MNKETMTIPLPPGWTWTMLGEIIEFQYGKGLTESKRDQSGSVPVYGSNGIVGYHSVALVNEPCLVVGRKGAAGEVHISRGPCWPIDTTYFVFTPEGLNLSFAYYLLRTFRLGSLDRSTAIPGLNRNDAYSIAFGLPPLPEQRRIVEKIEALFSELDKGVEQLKTAAQQLKVYRQSVLKWAFEGKLTEEWRNCQNQNSQNERIDRMKMRATNSENSVHPENSDSDNLLTRIKQEREALAQATGKRLKPIAPLTEKELAELPPLPEGWAWVRSGELFGSVTSGSRGWARYYSQQGALFIRITNLDFDSLELDLAEEKLQHVMPPNGVEGIRTRVEQGDFLFSITGYLGMFAIAQGISEAYVNQHIALVRPTEGFDKKFFGYWVISRTGGHFYLNQKEKGATKAGLGLDDITSFPVPFCDLEEQHQIVQEIESRLSVCDKLEETIAASLQQSEALRQSILKKAFEGKLVEQDPNDPPASELLQRIKNEKAKLEKK